MLKELVRVGLLLCCCLLGCSKEKIDSLVDQAKDAAGTVSEGVVDKVESAAGEAMDSAKQAVDGAVQTAGDVAMGNGSATITLDAPTAFDACFVQLLPIEGRPSVLKIASSRPGDHDAFPQFLVQSQVQAQSLQELSGQTVPARVFAQKDAAGPIWYSAEQAPVSVAIQVTEGKVTATLANANLIDSRSGQSVSVSGSFECASL